jgi:hypothetical protein
MKSLSWSTHLFIRNLTLARYDGIHLESELLGKQRQENHQFKASLGKDTKTASNTIKSARAW